jgi:hypothetical protein
MRVSKVDPKEKEIVKAALKKLVMTRKVAAIAIDCGVTQASLFGFLSTGSLGEDKFNTLRGWLDEQGALDGIVIEENPESGSVGESEHMGDEAIEILTDSGNALVQETQEEQEARVKREQEEEEARVKREQAKSKEREEAREAQKKMSFEKEYIDVLNNLNRLMQKLRETYPTDKDLPGFPRAEYESLLEAEAKHKEDKTQNVNQ